MLLARDSAGNEDAQMADGFVDRVDDGLAVGADFIDVVIEIENPSERLLRRRDVVALRAEHDDRRADVAQIDGRAVGCLDFAGGKLVADEQVVDDGLDFLAVQIDVAAPPSLEAEIARRLGVDF